MEDKNQEVTVFNNSDFGQIRVIDFLENQTFVLKSEFMKNLSIIDQSIK